MDKGLHLSVFQLSIRQSNTIMRALPRQQQMQRTKKLAPDSIIIINGNWNTYILYIYILYI